MAVRLHGFRPSQEKVYHIDVHPTLPWIVSSDGDDQIVLWDWEHSQILYELNAGGVDQNRLVDAQLQRMADTAEDGVGSKGRAGAEAIRGGGVKDVRFYDEDVRFWSFYAARQAFSESPTVTAGGLPVPPIGGCPAAIRGRRFLFMCCENKAIILDLVTRRAKDLPKILLENRTPLCVEFLPAALSGDQGPFAAFGGPDGAIRVLSLSTWQFVKKLTGGHKGAVHCLLPFIAGNGEIILASGGADGSLVMWAAADGGIMSAAPVGGAGNQSPQHPMAQHNSVQLNESVQGVPAGVAPPQYVQQANPMREVAPKFVIPKAHEGGVHVISLLRVPGSSPQLLTCGADKCVAVWDTMAFHELRRVKGVIPKTVVHSVAGWSHPRVPTVNSLACAKDSHIWALDNTGGSRAVCDLLTQVPPTPQIAQGKKLKVYCMLPHPLQPHLVITGTNVGVVITNFDPRSVPPSVALPPATAVPLVAAAKHWHKTQKEQQQKANKEPDVARKLMVGVGRTKEAATPIPDPVKPQAEEGGQVDPKNTVLFWNKRQLYALSFEAVAAPPPAQPGVADGRASDAAEPLLGPKVRQVRLPLQTPQGGHDSHAKLEVSKSGRFVSIQWPEASFYQVIRLADMTVVDSGSGRLLAWDICRDRYATLGGASVPTIQRQASTTKRGIGKIFKSSKDKKEQREAEAAAAQAAAAAAAVMAVANIEIKTLELDDGQMAVLCSAVDTGRKEPVTALHSGALLGVAYRMPKRASLSDQEYGGAGPDLAPKPGEISLLDLAAGDTGPRKSSSQAAAARAAEASGASLSEQMEQPANFQLFSWETFGLVSGLLPEPLWSLWDPIVEYCAMVYETEVVIAALRPQFRCLGRVAVKGATSGAWQRRQLFLATPTSVECVFVDAGVSEIDVETRRRKAQLKRQKEEEKVVREKGEIALLEMEPPKPEKADRVQLRPPMLQVVRLASFSSLPSVPPISAMVRVRLDLHASAAAAAAAADAAALSSEEGGSEQGLLDGPDSRPPEMAVGGGGVQTAPGPLPMEQRRPIGPVSVVGVRDGVLWLVDRYMSAYAVNLVHPGIRCRCLAAYGDPVGAVKWASRLGREHQDELAKFMVGMGYAKEALHLPGLSKRFEYELALQSGDLERALLCLKALSRPPKWSTATAAAAAYEGSAAAPVPLPQGTGLGDPLGGLSLGSALGGGSGLGMAFDSTGILAMAETQANMAEAAAGIATYAQDLFMLIDSADATGNADVARHALHMLAGAGLQGALGVEDLRRLSVRLATHGEGNRLQAMVTALASLGMGREAADAAALLGDATVLEKVWQETAHLPEAALHAQSHGRPTLKVLLQAWNKMLLKQEAQLSASQLMQSAHFQTLFGNIEQRLDPWEALAPAAKEPPVEIVAPGDYSFKENDTPLLPQMPAPVGSAPQRPVTPSMWGPMVPYQQPGAAPKQGVQGLAQPLDLRVLEGAGKKGPAPQKAAGVAVPVHFAAFQQQPKPAPAPAPSPTSAQKQGQGPAQGQGSKPSGTAAPTQKDTGGQQPRGVLTLAAVGGGKSQAGNAGANAGAQAPSAPAGRAGGMIGPTMADLDWAVLEANAPR